MKITAKEIAKMRLSGKKPDAVIALVLGFDYFNEDCLIVNFPYQTKPNFIWAKELNIVVVINNETRPERLIEVVNDLLEPALTLHVLNVETGAAKQVKDENGIWVERWALMDEILWEQSHDAASCTE